MATDHPSDRYDTGKEPDLAITYDRKERLCDPTDWTWSTLFDEN